jgi:ligand-binding sensor domain-containing protein
MRRPFQIVMIAIPILLAFSATRAQAQYSFDHWTTDDGLPQNTIRGLVQTRDGYLWFTTFDGLVRFDGVRFTVFDKSNTPGFASNRFTAIRESNDGTLYASTEEGSLTIYREGVFTTYTRDSGLPGKGNITLVDGPGGEPIIRATDGSYHLRQNRFVPVPAECQTRPNGGCYPGRGGKLWSWDSKNVTLHQDGRVSSYPLRPGLVEDNYTTQLLEDRTGNLWVSSTRGLYLLQDGEVKPLIEPEGDLSSSHFRVEAEDSEGGIWCIIGAVRFTQNHLARYKDGRLTVFGADSGIPESDIGQIIRDREGTIWLGTSNGLYRARKQIITAYSTEAGLTGKEVYPILQTQNGDILVGTVGGISRFHNGKFTELLKAGGGAYPQALWEDPGGRLWVGHVGNMSWYEGGKLTEPDLFTPGTVAVVRPDREGNVWVGGSEGLFKFNNDKIVAKYSTENGLLSSDVKEVYQSRDGTLWIGTYGGLAQLKDGKLTSWSTRDGLASDRVRSIYEDAEGTLWIGTYDGGLPLS